MATAVPGLESRTIRLFLAARGLEPGPLLDAFLTPRLASLTPPQGMAGRDAAADRICRAISEGAEIAIFGDYDCDGMTATALLADALELLGARVTTWLASRFEGGYGFSEAALGRILERPPGLVVTCDCGSSDHATLRALKARGIDAVVVDHHLVPEEPLPVLAFLNPHRPECDFPFKHLASCGLVFVLAAAVRAKLGKKVDLRPLLELVAVGSIADVVPLVGDNRILVRAGLSRLMNPERPGFIALLDLLGFERNQPVTAQDVAFRIAPRLNAPGRMGAPDLALELLREKDLTRARVLAERLDAVCQERRSVQEGMQKEAEAEVESAGYASQSAIVLGRQGWNHGIVGIVAGRLAEKYDRPVVVVGFDGGVGAGSVRGPAGFPLHDAVSACQELLIRFGGHQAACGLSLAEDRLPEFRQYFVRACASCQAQPVGEESPCVDLEPGDSLASVLADLYLLEPCGQDNPGPRLRLRGRVANAREVRGGHLRLELDIPETGRVVGFGPNLGKWADLLTEEATVEGHLRPDRYRGGGAVELLLTDVSRG